MLYVGLDVHWRTSTMCILNSFGRQVKQQTVAGGWERLLAALAKVPAPFAVCYEASCGYGHLYDRLRERAEHVVVAHPGQLRLIFRAKRKNDRVDACKLAKLLYLNEVPQVHVPNGDVRAWRQLIEHRRRLIDKRTRTKNGLRALLRSYGRRWRGRLGTRAGRAFLADVVLGTRAAQLQRDMLLGELQLFDEQVGRVTAALDELGRRHPGVGLLQTIPGVGPRTAEAVMAYIDVPERFPRVRGIGAYFGLVPCQDGSAGVDRLGHITCTGPSTARKLLVESAWQVIRHSPTAQGRFDRLVGAKPERRKIAAVAIAHWLSRCMLAMLRTGEVWREAA